MKRRGLNMSRNVDIVPKAILAVVHKETVEVKHASTSYKEAIGVCKLLNGFGCSNKVIKYYRKV